MRSAYVSLALLAAACGAEPVAPCPPSDVRTLTELAETAPLDSTITFLVVYSQRPGTREFVALAEEGADPIYLFATRPEWLLAAGPISSALAIALLDKVLEVRVSGTFPSC